MVDEIKISAASENNLKEVSLTIPKGKLVVFAGVSGSGKSSLAFGTIAVESARQWQNNYSLYIRNKMPHYERPVEIGGGFCVDGGLHVGIPLRYFESIGYERNVVITTRQHGYRRQGVKAICYHRKENKS